MDKPEPPSLNHTVVCRPSSNFWTMVGTLASTAVCSILLGLDSLRHAPPFSNDRFAAVMFLLISAGLLLGAAAAARWALHARIETDIHGIRWRHWGEWRSLAWTDVTDYYLLPLRPQTIQCVLEGGEIRLVVSPKQWRDAGRLQEIVIQQATNTVQGEWEVLGCRKRDTEPRQFTYDTKRHRRNTIAFGAAGLAIILLGLIPPLEHFTNTRETIGVNWAMGSVGIMLIPLLPVALILFVAQAPHRDALSRAGQTIQTNAAGIFFECGDRVIYAPWSEIAHYNHWETGARIQTVLGRRIETRNGAFDFTTAINNYLHLCQIVEHWIPKEAKEELTDDGVIGGEASLWTGGRSGVGERIYHYRTNIARGLILSWALFTSAPFFSGLVNGFAYLWRDKFICALLVVEMIVLFAFYLGYRCTSITLTENAFTKQSSLGVTQIPWSEIVHYENDGGWLKVSSRRKTILVSPFVTYPQELMMEIEHRAVNSVNKGWKAKKSK
jgi:hypothetical protein